MVDYESDNVPDDYRCSTCQSKGGKLWRSTGSFTITIYCLKCAMSYAGVSIEAVHRDGTVDSEVGRTDHFWGTSRRGLVPCVPTPNGGFWPFGAVPADAQNWWRRLPNQGSTLP